MKKLIQYILFLIFISTTPSWAEISSPILGQLDNGLRYTILPLHQHKNRLDISIKVHAGYQSMNKTIKQVLLT